MEIQERFFLFRLYREFKLLFVVVVVLLLGTLWFALKSHEEFPFLLYGMYSLKEESQNEYIAYSIVVHGKEIVYQNRPDAQQELVAGALRGAVSLPTNPLANEAFIHWLRAYSTNGEPLEIYKLTCVYAADGKPQIQQRELIYPHDEL